MSKPSEYLYRVHADDDFGGARARPILHRAKIVRTSPLFFYVEVPDGSYWAFMRRRIPRRSAEARMPLDAWLAYARGRVKTIEALSREIRAAQRAHKTACREIQKLTKGKR